MQSGRSEVCETVAALFLLAVKKIYKKTSLVHIKYTARHKSNSGRMTNVVETQTIDEYFHSCSRKS